MSQSRYIHIPNDIPFQNAGPIGPRPTFAFTAFIAILLADARFMGSKENVRSGLRILEQFESAPETMRPAGDVVDLHEVDWARLCQAMQEPQGGNSTLLADIARRVMRAGWYEVIETAPSSLPAKETPKLGTPKLDEPPESQGGSNA